jgi:hypothetical protein
MDSCTACGAQPQNLSRCSRCHGASYCNIACQKADWKSHKKICWNHAEVQHRTYGLDKEENDSSEECAICLGPLPVDHRARKLLGCGHTFCKTCYNEHLTTSETCTGARCPMYRRWHGNSQEAILGPRAGKWYLNSAAVLVNEALSFAYNSQDGSAPLQGYIDVASFIRERCESVAKAGKRTWPLELLDEALQDFRTTLLSLAVRPQQPEDIFADEKMHQSARQLKVILITTLIAHVEYNEVVGLFPGGGFVWHGWIPHSAFPALTEEAARQKRFSFALLQEQSFAARVRVLLLKNPQCPNTQGTTAYSFYSFSTSDLPILSQVSPNSRVTE